VLTLSPSVFLEGLNFEDAAFTGTKKETAIPVNRNRGL